MKAYPSLRTGVSYGAANRTKCFPWQKENVLGNKSDFYENHRGISLLTLLHRITPRANGGVVYMWESVHTQAYVTVCMSLCVCSKNSSTCFWVQHSLVQTCQLSDIPCHPWAVCLNTFKSFLLMQGTIKLSNGHNHYGKGRLYCQQFEHCLLPGSADEMSGAQYFKAINLSAFLFSLITF